MSDYVGISPATVPATGTKLRLTVRRIGDAKRILAEALTLTTYDTSVQKLADAWMARVGDAGCGAAVSPPVTDEGSGHFVIDMAVAGPALSLSTVVSRWEDAVNPLLSIISARVVRVESLGMRSETATQAADGRSEALEPYQQPGVLNRVGDIVGDASRSLLLIIGLAVGVALYFAVRKQQ